MHYLPEVIQQLRKHWIPEALGFLESHIFLVPRMKGQFFAVDQSKL
jgi:hypothetical protein